MADASLHIEAAIRSQIEAAIRVASVHISIFSPRYAESEWCLNELLWMVKTGKPIIPVFYKVKPEHLRWTGTEKDGPYAIALRKHEQRHGTETIQRWIKALNDVANICGLELEAFNGQEEELLEKVEQSVLKICPPSLDAAKYPTGLRQPGNRGSRNGGRQKRRNPRRQKRRAAARQRGIRGSRNGG